MLSKLLPSTRSSLCDLLVVVGLLIGGLVYHWPVAYWSNGLIGGEPYGDAHFWWEGAVRVSEGFFDDHPGKGFRPGYFVLTGVVLPVLGPDQQLFHKFLLLNFLAASVLLYLALREPLGRIASACGTALLVVNPYTAEWIATTTTDGMGLVLHLASLACLLLAVRANLHRGWLAGFGCLFAIATLTRPLITPFIGLVPVVLVLLTVRSWRERLTAAAVTVTAFCVPTVLWMGVQRAYVGEWSISTNDASALYAASNPTIQVWSPGMYGQIEAKARARHGRQDITPAQLNNEFRRQTIRNYLAYPSYHLQRAVPHLWAIATFSPRLATHGTTLVQTSILTVVAGLLALQLLLRGQWLRAGVLAASGGVLWLTPHAPGFMTLAGCALMLLIRPGRSSDLVLFLVASYWLTGVLALFLTGGTWQPTHAIPVEINALGYRIGSQFFFVGDLLACAFLLRLATLNLPAEPQSVAATSLIGSVRGWLARFGTLPLRPAVAAVGLLLVIVVAGDVAVLTAGASMVARRTYVNMHAPTMPYPDLAAVIELHRQQVHPDGEHDLQVASDTGKLAELLTPDRKRGPESPDVLVTATTGVCSWDLPGQTRTLLYLHHQDLLTPYRLAGGGIVAEVPDALDSREWSRRQGAFILRGTVDLPPASNLAYHQIAPAIRAWVPASADGTGYDLGGAMWFPLTRYASQLQASGSLTVSHGGLTWGNDPGPAPVRRRARLALPKDDSGDRAAGMTLKLDRAVGKRSLHFGWQPEPRRDPHATPAELQVWAVRSGNPDRQLLLTQPAPAGQELTEADIDCTYPDITALELSFGNLKPGSGVWLYELKLTADDFRP